MYSKTPKCKASKGSVVVHISHERLQLWFRVAGQRKYVSLGLSDSPENWKLAEMKAKQIELDILSGHFDETLASYKPQSVLSVASPDITPKPTPKLKDIWDQYLDYKTPHASPKTINGTYLPVSTHIGRCTFETNIVSFAFFSLGMVGTTAFTIMMDKSRPEMAGTDYTLQTSLISIDSVISAAVSGVLAEVVGYHGVFALSGVLGLVCLMVIARGLALSTSAVSQSEAN